MPKCQGRPDLGHCPNNKNDHTVKWSVCDLFLCPECYDFRIPDGPLLGDNMASAATDTTADKTISNDRPAAAASSACVEINELLCYLQQKSKILAFDDLVGICANFYTNEEIERARILLAKYVTQKRLGKLRGSDKDVAHRTVSSLLKVCLDASVKMPIFAAVNLPRLPPVGVDHIDISSLLQEVAALRHEVRAVASVRAEVAELQRSVLAMPHVNSIVAAPARSQVQQVERIAETTMPTETGADNITTGSDTWQTAGQQRRRTPANLEVVGTAGQPAADLNPSTAGSAAVGHRSAAQVLAAAVSSGALPPTTRKSGTIVGKAEHRQLKAVHAKKPVDPFVTRLDPVCAADDVQSCVFQTLSSRFRSQIAMDNIKIEKLKSKFDSYVSYHVSVAVESNMVRDVSSTLMNCDIWPYGVLVRRFF